MFYDTDGDDMIAKGGPPLINLIKTQDEILKSILTFGTSKEKSGKMSREDDADFSDDD